MNSHDNKIVLISTEYTIILYYYKLQYKYNIYIPPYAHSRHTYIHSLLKIRNTVTLFPELCKRRGEIQCITMGIVVSLHSRQGAVKTIIGPVKPNLKEVTVACTGATV